MKPLLLASVLALASCTTNEQLNAKLIDVSLDIVTLGITQKAPEPQPLTHSK